jgi:hypothetical protein
VKKESRRRRKERRAKEMCLRHLQRKQQKEWATAERMRLALGIVSSDAFAAFLETAMRDPSNVPYTPFKGRPGGYLIRG